MSTDELVLSYKDNLTNTLDDRMKVVGALRCVDIVVPQKTLEKQGSINEMKVDILVMGGDWTGKHDYANCKTIYFPYTEGISTTKIKERINNEQKS